MIARPLTHKKTPLRSIPLDQKGTVAPQQEHEKKGRLGRVGKTTFCGKVWTWADKEGGSPPHKVSKRPGALKNIHHEEEEVSMSPKQKISPSRACRQNR